MRRLTVLFLLFLFCFSLSGCGEKPTYTDYTGYLTSGNSADSSASSAPTAVPDLAQQAIVPVVPTASLVPAGSTQPGGEAQDFANVVTIVSTPGPVTVPAGAAAPAYTPVPTPVPTPAPTPAPNLVRITKSPTSETVEEGGSAMFIAYAENYDSIVWITVSPDKQTSYEIGDARRQFGNLGISGQGTSTLSLSNIPYEMNGWRIQAYFTGNGGPLYTAGAYLTVIPAGGGGTGVYTGALTDTESYAKALAQQAYSDISFYATADRYSVGALADYSYSNAVADFTVTVSNGRCRIIGEFKAYYYGDTNYGYGPVHALVYDATGTLTRSEHLTDKNMSYYYSILDSNKG